MGTINDMLRKLDRFQNEIESLSGKTFTVLPDKKGMIDKQCPKDECNSFFKVNSEDWKNIVKDDEVFCPFCRNNSKAQDYLPNNQRKELVSTVRQSIMNFWHYEQPISQNIVSIQSTEEFELHIQCEKCEVRFSVIGTAYFCPSCGYNSVERTAKDAIEKLLLKADKISKIQESLEQALSKDEAAIVAKSIIENSLSECIGTLQTFSETKYNHLTNTTAPFNAFQNVEKSNNLWMSFKGQNYKNWLSADEVNDLIIFTQRRHLLEHKGGLVDAKYLQTTNDTNYTVGNRLIVKPEDIIALGKIVLKIIDNINKL
jgi:uncharacterized Zn finger protein (UPF0148 family)